MCDDLSLEGDLGLSLPTRTEVKTGNSSRQNGVDNLSCSLCDNRSRRAVIRTLSGTWVQQQSEYKNTGRRNSYEGDGRSDDHSGRFAQRYGSFTCCPEVLKKLRRRIGNHLDKDSDMDDDWVSQHQRDTEDLLKEANKTIAALQGKLDVYEDLLYGKSKASEVLLNQLSESVRARANSEAKWRSEAQEQRLEASRLQFQLLSFEGNLTDSQRAWLERINSVVKENSELQSTVQTQTRLIRRLSSERTVWKKESEELYLQEDTKAHLISDTHMNSTSTEQAILELAILGSCTCRSKKQEPCACAKSACRRQHQVALLQTKVSELEEQKEEMVRLMEIYRDAFEEQLGRNRSLTKKIAQMDRENELAVKSARLHGLLRLRIQRDSQSNVVNSLVDMVCDRTDALQQQQILTKLLSRRLTELENKNIQ